MLIVVPCGECCKDMGGGRREVLMLLALGTVPSDCCGMVTVRVDEQWIEVQAQGAKAWVLFGL